MKKKKAIREYKVRKKDNALGEYKVLLHIDFVIPVYVRATSEDAASQSAMNVYGNGGIEIEDSISHVDHSETFGVKSVEKE